MNSDFVDYVKANSGRKEVLEPAHIRTVLAKIDRRLSDPKWKAKHSHYRKEKKYLENVLEVLENG